MLEAAALGAVVFAFPTARVAVMGVGLLNASGEVEVPDSDWPGTLERLPSFSFLPEEGIRLVISAMMDVELNCWTGMHVKLKNCLPLLLPRSRDNGCLGSSLLE